MLTLIDLIERTTGKPYTAAPAEQPAPAAPEARQLVAAYLSGRCANGYARDRGRVVHAVEATVRDGRTRIGFYSRALCGVTHGARSAGWTHEDAGTAVTCPKCARLADKT